MRAPSRPRRADGDAILARSERGCARVHRLPSPTVIAREPSQLRDRTCPAGVCATLRVRQALAPGCARAVPVTSIGYGDIGATTWVERLVAIIVMLVSSLLWGQLVGTLVSIISTFNPEATEFRQTSEPPEPPGSALSQAHARLAATPPHSMCASETWHT